MKCSKCNQESTGLLTLRDDDNKKTHYVCYDCFAADLPDYSDKSAIEQIEEFDNELEELESLFIKFESLSAKKAEPDLSDIPLDAAAFIFTPSKAQDFSKAILDASTKKRMVLLEKLTEKDKLLYQLRKSLKVEDYEQAAIYRDRIKELEN